MATSTQNVNLVITAKDRASLALKTLANNSKKAALGLTAIALAGTKLAADAAKGLDLQAGFIRNFGENIDKNLGELRGAARDTIGDLDLMASSNKAALLGVSDNTKELGLLMQTASLRGRELGLTTTQAFDDIVTGIGRGSPLILDNLGIKIPDAIKEMTLSMDEATKTQTLLQFAILDGILIAEEYANGIDSAADAQQQFKAAVKNAGNALGKALLPSLLKAANFIVPLIRRFSAFIGQNKELITNIVKTTAVIAGVVGAFVIAVKAVSAVQIGVGLLQLAIGALTSSVTLATAATGILGVVLIGLGAILGSAIKDEIEASKQTNKLGLEMSGAGDKAKKMQDEMNKLGTSGSKAGKKIADSMQKATDRLRELEREIERENELFNEQLANIVDSRNDALKENKKQLKQEIKEFENAIKEKKKRLKDETSAINEESKNRLDTLQQVLDVQVSKGANANEAQVEGLKRQIEEEKTLAAQKKADVQQRFDDEAKELKAEFDESTNALKTKISEDEKILEKHAEVIKGINRDIIKDEIAQLVESHDERLEALDKQIIEEKKRFDEGAANFGGATGIMADDWDAFLGGLDTVDWDTVTGEISLTSIIDRLKVKIGDLGLFVSARLSQAFTGFSLFLSAAALSMLRALQGSIGKLPIIGEKAGKLFDDSIKDIQKDIKVKQTKFDQLGASGDILKENLATGTNSARGGLTLVGEEGPELVDMPRGARVFNAGETNRILDGAQAPGGGEMGGEGVVINVNIPLFAGSEAEKRSVAEGIWKEIIALAKSRGKTPDELLNL